MTVHMTPLTLLELNGLVRSAIEATFPGHYWLKAELSEVRESESGHCYLTFVEKSRRTGQPVAVANGRIWQNVYAGLRPYFEHETGQRLAPGMTVLVSVSVNFHERYGLAYNVDDIDPTYTLGDQNRRRREIVARLEREGVALLNRELPWPRPAARIAIVSSATAAGLGDFRDQLAASPYRFSTQLFPAIMQGEQTEASVIAALDRIASEREQWDVVVIIRGGGAVTDLSGFDTYALADNVAQFPLPVLSGIGHDRDETVIDLVAYKRLKTPTAVAAFLIDRMAEEADALERLSTRLYGETARHIANEKTKLGHLAKHLALVFSLRLSHEDHRATDRLTRLGHTAERRTRNATLRAENLQMRLSTAAAQRITTENHRLDLFDRTLEAADPARNLKRGYTITLRDGHIIASAAALHPGDRITTRMTDGQVESTIDLPSKTS